MDTEVNGFNLERSTEMVVSLKNNIGKGLIQLGSHISIVKENLPHKDYLDWLKYEVKIHRATAWRYMKIAKDVDPVTLERVGSTKILEILEAPITDEEKKNLMDVGDQMTVSEIREKVDVPKNKPASEGTPLEAQELDSKIEEVIDHGIDFVEEVGGLQMDNVADNWQRFVKSQLRMIIRDLEESLSRL